MYINININKTKVVWHTNKRQFMMYLCLEISFIVFCVGIFHSFLAVMKYTYTKTIYSYGIVTQGWFHMESYGIPCYIYRDGQPGRVVCKLTTDKFQGTKPRYRPDFRETYLYTLCVTHLFTYLHSEYYSCIRDCLVAQHTSWNMV